MLLDEIARIRAAGVDREIFTLCKNEKYGQLIENLENVEDSASQMADFALTARRWRSRSPCWQADCRGRGCALQHILSTDRMAVMDICQTALRRGRETRRKKNDAIDKSGAVPGLGLSFDRTAWPFHWRVQYLLVRRVHRLGICLALVFAFRHSIEFGVDPDSMVDVILIGIVLGIVSARAYYVAMAPFKYQSIWEMIAIRDGGLAIYGASSAVFCSAAGLQTAQGAGSAHVRPDRYGLSAGQCCGRWGNFFNQEAFGCNTTLPWGMYSEATRAYLMGSTVTARTV